jgi:hypothetical protein
VCVCTQWSDKCLNKTKTKKHGTIMVIVSVIISDKKNEKWPHLRGLIKCLIYEWLFCCLCRVWKGWEAKTAIDCIKWVRNVMYYYIHICRW